MVIVETARNLFRVIDVFYPRSHELEEVSDSFSLNRIVHIRQAQALLDRRGTRLYRPFETLLFDLTRDVEELFSEVHKTTRNLIRQAQRVHDRIEVRRNDAAANQDFLSIYNNIDQSKEAQRENVQ